MLLCVCRITYVPAEYLEDYRASQQLLSDDLSDGKNNTQQYVLHSHFILLALSDLQSRRIDKKNESFVFVFSETVSDLPEREDGEGQESERQTAASNNWNLSRR